MSIDPLKLAEQFDAAEPTSTSVRLKIVGTKGLFRLLAAALRHAEASCALKDLCDREPDVDTVGVYSAWSEEHDVLRLRVVDAERDYRAAKEAK